MKTSQLAEVRKQGELAGMRHENPSITARRSAGNKLNLTDIPVDLPRMPVEWLDSGTWRLPSGKALAEFALQAGFLAPLLFRAERFGAGEGRHADPVVAGIKHHNKRGEL
jgi:hypothetical protein